MLWKLYRINPNDLKYPTKHIKWSEEQKRYKENIIINGYNPRISIIKISKDFKIIDGHHRVESSKLRGDNKIVVVKINFNFWTVIILYILFFLVTSPIWIPALLIKKLKYGFKKCCSRNQRDFRK